ncbi:class I SAM-dependent RNA methyltransferase [Actinomyces sp. zg328]|uniref:class I SAM-dependent RNA methyltransferase n=1 Tax=Actinomyces sp. zg328 TaxID=2609287 RepID=UPI00135CD6ED|nr:TRAM domain-containing protein [Actinomyces sp. zg328]
MSGRGRGPARQEKARGGAHEPEEMILVVGPPAHGGHCVARPQGEPEGRVVFVRHALPGETVRARITARTSKMWRADAVEALTASPDRVEPVWPEAGPGGVGGGELSHVALPAQRTWKRWVLADCLRRIGGPEVAEAVLALPSSTPPGGVPVEPMPCETAAETAEDPRVRALAGTGTRTRVELAIGDDGAPGMHAFRSATILPVRDLPLAVPAIRDLGLTTRGSWRRRLARARRVQAVAPSTGAPVVIVDGTVLSASGRPLSRQRVDESVDASGLGLGELRYTVRADAFWQVHRDAPRALVEAVTRAALGDEAGGAGASGAGRPGGPRVLELYSGSGLLTLPLALLGGEVISLEGSERAVRDADRNLRPAPRARLMAGRVTGASVTELGRSFSPGGDGRADVVVLDPPRQGAGRDVIEAIVGAGPARVVLVACDPAALARDVGSLLRGGYRLEGLRALDMFPHTHHFETIAVLQRP